MFAAHGGEIAALIVEPLMQGAAGMWAQPPGYLPALRELTRRHGALLICDEVATGFGRTGRMFAVEHEGVEPDLLCLGKGLTGGYLPLAATLASEEIFDGLPRARTSTSRPSSTATPTPAIRSPAPSRSPTSTSSSASAVLARVQDARRAARRRCSPSWRSDLPHVGDIRQWGLMVGIELVRDRGQATAYDPAEKIGQRVIRAARRRGVILRPLGNVIILMPPLSITAEELDLLVRVTARIDREATGSAEAASAARRLARQAVQDHRGTPCAVGNVVATGVEFDDLAASMCSSLWRQPYSSSSLHGLPHHTS